MPAPAGWRALRVSKAKPFSLLDRSDGLLGLTSGVDTGVGSRCRIAWRGARWLIAKMISGTTALAALAQITLVLVPRLARTPVRSRSLALSPSLPLSRSLAPSLCLAISLSLPSRWYFYIKGYCNGYSSSFWIRLQLPLFDDSTCSQQDFITT